MNYRVFRWLIIGSIVTLLSTLTLLFFLLFSGRLGSLSGGSDVENRKLTRQLQQLIQQIADNQGKLISSNQQVNQLLDIPPKDYDQLPLLLSVWASSDSDSETVAVNADSANSQTLLVGSASTNADVQEKSGSPLEVAFYDALRYLGQNLQQEQAWEQLNQMLDSKQWQDLLQNAELRLERSEEAVLLFPANDKLLPRGQVASKWFRITAIKTNSASGTSKNELRIQSSFQKARYTGPLRFTAELDKYIGEQSKQLYRLASQYSEMYHFLSSKPVQRQLAAKHLHIKSLQAPRVQKVDTTGKYTLDVAQTDWEVRTRDDQVVVHFYFDIDQYQLLWNGKSYQSLQLLRSDWDIFVANVDTRTAGQRQEEQMRQYLQKMLADSAFLLQMQQYGLRPADLPPREDEYYEYYDLLNAKGERVASFALQKRIGETYLMDKDDVKIRGLKSFITGAVDLQSLFGAAAAVPSTASNSAFQPGIRQSPGIPQADGADVWLRQQSDQRDHDIEVILLVGTHDTIADVIMLVSINKETRTLTMISLPRDLYYQEAKINAIYSMYGPEPFMEVLSQITGLSISKYVSMDMYAFIDVVDLIGGIDVYLKEDLIDPTYKIKQMGKWQTLVMRKGQHHLDGLGALRYARSRHTSNDFERSDRQQLILNQVAEKLRKELGNPKKLLPFLRVLQKYIQTNFSTTEIASYWLKYGSYRRNFGNTVNTNNVLYYTFTNYMDLSPEELAKAQQDENFSRGTFILLPFNDDWSLIRKYIMHLQNN